MTQAKFLFSRQALLDHLQKTEKLLAQKVTSYKAKDSFYQQALVEKYLALQDDLKQLKQLALKSKSETGQSPQENQWDNKKVDRELKKLLGNFDNFLQKNGFI